MSVTRPAILRKWGAAAAAAVLTVGLGACTDDGTPELRSGNNQGYIEGDGTATMFVPEERQTVPDVAGTTLQGEPLALSEFAGDVVVLNIWASWCGPCRAEAPALNEVAKENRDKGVQFVGLNTSNDDKAAALAFEDTYDVTYPSVFDPTGQQQLLFSTVLPPVAFPSTLIIDRDGKIAARVLGETDYTQLSKLVDDVVAEGSRSD